jgi:hypothetical protein
LQGSYCKSASRGQLARIQKRAALPQRLFRNGGYYDPSAYPEVRKRLADLGRDDRSMPPADVLAFIQGEQAKWGLIVQEIAAMQTQNK